MQRNINKNIINKVSFFISSFLKVKVLVLETPYSWFLIENFIFFHLFLWIEIEQPLYNPCVTVTEIRGSLMG